MLLRQNEKAKERISAAVQGGVGAVVTAVAAMLVPGLIALPVMLGVEIVAAVAAVVIYQEGIEGLCGEARV